MVVDHRAVSGPGSHTWLVAAPEGWEARPTKLPEAMPENLLNPQPNLKKTNYLYANGKKGIMAGTYKISYLIELSGVILLEISDLQVN